MKKARVVAVCAVGLVLALLLGGASTDQTQAAIAPALASTQLPLLGESLGVVLDLAGATTWTINGNKVTFLPVPHTDVSWRQPQAINPMKPGEVLAVPESFVRRSLWFMPIGEKMLWGTLVVDNKPLLVFAKRLTENDYQITVESLHGDIIIIAQGVLRRLDNVTGRGILESQSPSIILYSQKAVLYKSGPTTIVMEEIVCKKCVIRCTTILFTLFCECTMECYDCVIIE